MIRDGGSQPDQYTKSDETGSFKFKDVKPRAYQLTAEADGYAKAPRQTVNVDTGEVIDNLVIEFEGGTELTGHVFDPQGQPLRNATVALLSHMQNPNLNVFGIYNPVKFTGEVTTDLDGSFTIKHVSQQGDTVLVRHDAFASQLQQIQPEHIDQSITIQLSQGGTIEGLVLDEQGKPMVNASISCFDYPNNLFGEKTTTDENGEYRFENLFATTYIVRKEANSSIIREPEYKQVRVENSKTVRADFGAGEGCEISGTVFEGESPKPNAYVSLIEKGGWPRPQELSTFSQADGRYSFKGVQAGDYVIMFAVNPQQKPLHYDGMESFTIAEEQTSLQLDLHAKEYVITGQITDAESGDPLAHVQIQQNTQSNPYFEIEGKTRMVSSNAQGEFRISVHDSGSYRFFAMKEGYTMKSFSVDVPNTSLHDIAQPIRVDIVMEKEDTDIKVVLIHKNQPYGKPAMIQFSEFNHGILNIPHRRANDLKGTFVLNGLSEGIWTIMAHVLEGETVYAGVSEPVEIKPDQGSMVFINLLETRKYFVDLNLPADTPLGDTIQFEISGFPQLSIHPKFQPSKIGDYYSFRVPEGIIPVRMTVPGYQPLEFVPAQLERDNSNLPVTLNLKRN